MSVKTYNPADVVIVFAGVTIDGFDDGTFLTIGRDNPSFVSGTGSSGEGWRAKSNDKAGTATVTLLQMSAANDALSALLALDEASGDGIGPLLVKDNSGTSLYSAATAWIEKPSDGEFARSKSSREWVIKTDDLEIFVGGNTIAGA